MEPTDTAHPRLQAETRWAYCLHECDQAVIARAIEKARRGETAWSKKPDSEGAALGERTITDGVLHYRMDGVDNALDEERDVSDPGKRYVPKTDDGRPRRAERVWVEATIGGSTGGSDEVEIETDLAFLDPDEHWPTEFAISLSADTEIAVDELVKVLVDACFQPRDGEHDDDSAETQRDNFDDHALWVGDDPAAAPQGSAGPRGPAGAVCGDDGGGDSGHPLVVEDGGVVVASSDLGRVEARGRARAR